MFNRKLHPRFSEDSVWVREPRLPWRIGFSRSPDKEAKTILENAGVKFGDYDYWQPQLCHAKLPSGWQVVGTDHQLWWVLIDNEDRHRGHIINQSVPFFEAHLIIPNRFDFQVLALNDRLIVASVFDCYSKVVYRSEPVELKNHRPQNDQERAEFNAAFAASRDLALGWLRSNYPDWKNPRAYWREIC